MRDGCCRTSVGVIGKRPNQPRVAAVPVFLAPVQCARTPPVCQVTPHSTCRPVECGRRLVVARASGKNSHSGNRGPPGPSRRGRAAERFRPPAAGAPETGGGPVRGGGGGPGRFCRHGVPGEPDAAFRRQGVRKGPCVSVGRTRTGACRPDTRGGVRQPTHHLAVSCEASPQISAPVVVRTHQCQLTGTCKLFGMPRNRNTEAPRLVVIT